MSPRIVDQETLQEREQIILDAALDYIRENDIASLTVDKVVARVPFSKGTVYNHFCSKEDIVTGLCNLCVSSLHALFQEATDFEGNVREKMVAICIAYMMSAKADSTRFMLVITAKTPALNQKASEERWNKHIELEQQLMALFCSLIQKAIEDQDLVIPAHMSPPQIAFAIWSMSFGTIALLQEGLERCDLRRLMEVERELVTHCNLVMDGLGWLPLSQDFDWQPCINACKERVSGLV